MDGKSLRIGRFVLGFRRSRHCLATGQLRKTERHPRNPWWDWDWGQLPTLPVPVQDQGPELAGSIDREVTTKRPDVVDGIGRQARQPVRRTMGLRPNVRARHYLPTLAVPVQYQRALGLPVRVRRRGIAHRPSIVRRQRQHSLKPIHALAYVRSCHVGPFRAIPAHGKGLAVCALESNRPGIIRCVRGYAQKSLTRRGLLYSCRRPWGAVPVLEKVEASNIGIETADCPNVIRRGRGHAEQGRLRIRWEVRPWKHAPLFSVPSFDDLPGVASDNVAHGPSESRRNIHHARQKIFHAINEGCRKYRPLRAIKVDGRLSDRPNILRRRRRCRNKGIISLVLIRGRYHFED